MPLPKPTKAIKPKNVSAVLKPKKPNNKDNDKPNIKMPNPIMIMLSMPINVLYFPAKIVPSKKPRAGTAKYSQSTYGDKLYTTAPTKVPPPRKKCTRSKS